MSAMMTPTQVLTGAKSLLITHGWITGDFGGPTQGFCCVGAIRWSAGATTSPVAGSESVLQILAMQIRRRNFESIGRDVAKLRPADLVALWNDSPGRNIDEVIGLIDDALLEIAPPAPPRPVLDRVRQLIRV